MIYMMAFSYFIFGTIPKIHFQSNFIPIIVGGFVAFFRGILYVHLPSSLLLMRRLCFFPLFGQAEGEGMKSSSSHDLSRRVNGSKGFFPVINSFYRSLFGCMLWFLISAGG